MKILPNILPQKVVCREMRVEEKSSNLIFPQEAKIIKKAVQKRKNEFICSRICAREALAELGISDFPIITDKDKSPILPQQISGSITHTGSYCGAAFAFKNDIKSIGIDIENFKKMKPGIAEYICTNEEFSQLISFSEADKMKRAALIFSAKEAFYKLQYPLTKSWVGFKDAEVNIMDKENFTLRLFKKVKDVFIKDFEISGKYYYYQDLVFTAIVI